MKKIIITIGLFISFSTGICFAGNGAFYTETAAFLAKFSGNCPSGNVVQSICQHGATAVAPSNSYPYLGPGEILSNTGQTCDEMGTDPLSGWYFGDGELGSLVGESDFYLHGYIRAFSGKTISDSAYYGNSTIQAIAPSTSAASQNDITTDVTVGTVNPAYIISWIDTPKTNHPSTIVGTVDTAASDNNKLTDADVKVQVRVKPSGAWEDHNLPYTPGFAGDFQVKAIFVSGNFPVSATYDVDGVIPEPVFFGFLALVALAFFRRK